MFTRCLTYWLLDKLWDISNTLYSNIHTNNSLFQFKNLYCFLDLEAKLLMRNDGSCRREDSERFERNSSTVFLLHLQKKIGGQWSHNKPHVSAWQKKMHVLDCFRYKSPILLTFYQFSLKCFYTWLCFFFSPFLDPMRYYVIISSFCNIVA